MSSSNKRQKTAAAKAEQAMDEACWEALTFVEDLGQCERLRRKFKQFLEEADAKVAILGGERLGQREERIRQGQCPDCSLQTHDVKFTPLTNDHVTSGRCLFCNPTAPVAVAVAAAAAAEAGSSSSRAVSPLAVPEETEAKSVKFCDNFGIYGYSDGVWGDYTGDLDADGRRHGKGKITYENGEVYDGEWKNDKRDGQGSWRDEEGWAYDGGWKNDKKEGWGVTRRPDGTKYYEGEYKNGECEGHGTQWWGNGEKYVGGWREGVEEGQGVQTWANGDSYTGGWKGGQKKGKGIHRYADGRIEIRQHRNDWEIEKGVRWSANRQTAWLLNIGMVTREIDLSRATRMATRMGFPNVP